jgi:DNA repair protein SbcC/Rad50
MKEIRLKEMRLENFKGEKSQKVVFNGKNTFIEGQNGTRKSTLVDAYCYILTDKDQFNRKAMGTGAFDIKPANKDGELIPNISPETSIVLTIDGENVCLGKTLKVEWETKEDKCLPKSHSTEPSIDITPVNVTEYKKWLNDNIGSEETIRILTLPKYFCSMDWKRQRDILIAAVGGVDTDEQILSSNEMYEPLRKHLKNTSINTYLVGLIKSINLIDKSKDENSVRIDEAKRAIPESMDFELVRKEIDSIQQQIKEVENVISDKSKAVLAVSTQRSVLAQKISELSQDMSKHESEARNSISETLNKKDEEVKSLQREITNLQTQKEGWVTQINSLNEQNNRSIARQNEMKDEWVKTQKEFIFEEGDSFTCPIDKLHCDRLQAFRQGDVEKKKEELRAAFNTKLQEKYQSFSKEGTALSQAIKKNKEKVQELTDDIEAVSGVIEAKTEALEEMKKAPAGVRTSQTVLDENQEYQLLKKEKSGLEEEYNKPTEGIDTSNLQDEKNKLNLSLDAEKAKLQIETRIKEGNERVLELSEETKTLQVQYDELSKMKMLCNLFIRNKVNLYDSKINGAFGNVKFKFFDLKLNGEIEEVCEAMIDGVSWSSSNPGSKIPAGVEIINFLQGYYQLRLPIFIDEKESITSDIISESQVICLSAKEGVKQLTIKQ